MMVGVLGNPPQADNNLVNFRRKDLFSLGDEGYLLGKEAFSLRKISENV